MSCCKVRTLIGTQVFERGMTKGSTKLRELEKVAKQQKRGMWANYVPTETNSAKLTDLFVGKVIEVVSGDTIVVLDSANRIERRVQLSRLVFDKLLSLYCLIVAATSLSISLNMRVGTKWFQRRNTQLRSDAIMVLTQDSYLSFLRLYPPLAFLACLVFVQGKVSSALQPERVGNAVRNLDFYKLAQSECIIYVP